MNFALGFASACAAGLVLAWLWRRMGWVDAAQGAEASRKLQAVAVPAVGGLALLLAWHLGWFVEPLSLAGATGMEPGELRVEGYWRLNARPVHVGRWLLTYTGALYVAWFVGWIDDALERGLAPWAKALGQMFAGACLVLPGAVSELTTAPNLAYALTPVLSLVVYSVGGLIACNALNTFDNADGAAAGVSGAGLLAAASPLAPAVLGFAALQLCVRRGPKRDAVAYLGDSGSHLLGIVVLAVPATWPLLTLPLLDLARVSLERQRAGQPPWRGDRRHLAHRLQRRGLGSRVVALILVAISVPAIVWPGVPGLLSSTALFLLAVRSSRELIPPAPCPETVASR